MTQLIVAALFLLVSHFGISSTALRPWLVARIGERAYLGLYSLIALGAIVWVIRAWAHAPYVELWPVTAGTALVPLILMPFAFLLAVPGVSTPNPTSVGAPATTLGGDAVRGIFRVTRHPFQWSVVLWAAAHVIANGDLAGVILFGAFGALAGIGTLLIDRKYAARRGAEWQAFAGASSNLPFAAILAGRERFLFAEIGWARIAVALLLYVVLLALHPWLFGASPFAAVSP
jgi:uncharacterized membrane protein